MEKIIEVRNLQKSFKDNKVLKGVDITVNSGSIFALLGSNGAGKTTIIKILTTLLKPDKGSIKISNFDIIKDKEKIKNIISLNGQNVSVDYILTAKENIELIAKLRHIKDVKTEVDNLLKQFNLYDVKDKSVQTFSGGMVRRLDLAMTLVGNTPIIFLDEPTTGLDPQSRIALWTVIKDLAKKGKTIFLTTQYLEEAEQLADYISILDKGKIVKSGTVNQLKKLFESEKIVFTFESEKSFLDAFKVLEEYNPSKNEKMLSIDVLIDDDIKKVAQIFQKFDDANINVMDFYKKQPTLEEVFLAVIGQKGDDENDAKDKE